MLIGSGRVGGKGGLDPVLQLLESLSLKEITCVNKVFTLPYRLIYFCGKRYQFRAQAAQIGHYIGVHPLSAPKPTRAWVEKNIKKIYIVL